MLIDIFRQQDACLRNIYINFVAKFSQQERL